MTAVIARRLIGTLVTLFCVAVVIFVIATAFISHFLPEFDEVPAGFPVTLMWKFRVAAIEMQVLMWSVLGFLFGWFADRDLAAQRLHS